MDTIPIAQLERRDTSVVSKSIRGIVTLIWPYSSSTQRAAILLAEPDFRLRKNKGQVRVQLAGVTAQEVAKSKMSSGDEVVLSLTGAKWVPVAAAAGTISTPGRSVDIELEYERRLICEIYRAGRLYTKLVIHDQSPSEPHSGNASPDTPPRTSRPLSAPYLGPTNSLSTPASSAFHRRARVVSGELVDSPYDPFVSSSQDAVRHAHKKQRMSWGSDSRWTINDDAPSPSKRNARVEWIRDEDLESARTRKGKAPIVPTSPSPEERGSPGPAEPILLVAHDPTQTEIVAGRADCTQDLVDTVSGDTEEEDYIELINLGDESPGEESQLGNEDIEAVSNVFAGPGVFDGSTKFFVFKDLSTVDPLAVLKGSIFSKTEARDVKQNVASTEEEFLNLIQSNPPVAELESAAEPRTTTRLPEIQQSSRFADAVVRRKSLSPKAYTHVMETADIEEAADLSEYQKFRPQNLGLHITNMPPPLLSTLQTSNFSNAFTAMMPQIPQSALPGSPRTPDIRPQHSAALPLPSPFPGEELSSYVEGAPAPLRGSFMTPQVSSSSPVMPDWMLQFGFSFGTQGFPRSSTESPPKQSLGQPSDKTIQQQRQEAYHADESLDGRTQNVEEIVVEQQHIDIDEEEDDMFKIPTPTRRTRRTSVVSDLADKDDVAQSSSKENVGTHDESVGSSAALAEPAAIAVVQLNGPNTNILVDDGRGQSSVAGTTSQQSHYLRQHNELTAQTATMFENSAKDHFSAGDAHPEPVAFYAGHPIHSSVEPDGTTRDSLTDKVGPEVKSRFENRKDEGEKAERAEDGDEFDDNSEGDDESDEQDDDSEEEESEAEFASVYAEIREHASRSSTEPEQLWEDEDAEQEVLDFNDEVVTSNIRPRTLPESTLQSRGPVVIDLLDSDTGQGEDDHDARSENFTWAKPVSDTREPPPFSPITPRKAPLSIEAQQPIDEITTPHNDAEYAPSTPGPPTSSPMAKQESFYQSSIPTHSSVTFAPRVARRRAAADAESAAEFEPQSSIPLAHSQRYRTPPRLRIQDTFEGMAHSDGSLTTAPPSRGSDTSRATFELDENVDDDERGRPSLTAQSPVAKPVFELQSYDGAHDGGADFIASSPPAEHADVTYPDIPSITISDNVQPYMDETILAHDGLYGSHLPATPDQSQMHSQQSVTEALFRPAQHESHLPTPHQTQLEQSFESAYQEARTPLMPGILDRVPSEATKLQQSSPSRQDPPDVASSVLSPWFGKCSGEKMGSVKHEIKKSEGEDPSTIQVDNNYGKQHEHNNADRAEPSSYKPSSPSPPTQPVNSQTALPEFSFTQSQATLVQGLSTNLSYYVPLSNLYSHIRLRSISKSCDEGCVDIIALVTKSSSAPKKAEGGQRDWTVSLRVTDKHFHHGEMSMLVRIFRPWKAALPEAREGEVILMRGFEVFSAKGNVGVSLRSVDGAAWCVWRFGTDELDMAGSDDQPWAKREDQGVEEMKGPPVELGEQEREYARDLRKWWLDVEKRKALVSSASNL